MTPSEVGDLLTLGAALDPRLGGDQAAIRNRLAAWHTVLGGVDPEWAAGFVKRAYSHTRPQPLQPGDIADAWRSEEARRARPDPLPEGVPMPASVRAELARHFPNWGKGSRVGLGVACPWEGCRAKPGAPCTDGGGREMRAPHPSRADLAAARA